MPDFIKGDLIILSVHDGSVYRPVACLTSNSLQQTRNIIEAQTKCNPGVTIKGAGSMDYSIEAEGNYIDTTSVGGSTTLASHDWLKANGMDNGAELTWRMATGLADTAYYYGTGFLSDLGMEAPAGDEFTTFSATLSGSGAIVTVDPITP